MLEFNKEFLKEINACKWLKNCGNYEDLAFDFPVQIAKNKKNAKKNSTLIPIAKFCLYLHKIFRRFRFAETATPFFGLRRTQENDG